MSIDTSLVTLSKAEQLLAEVASAQDALDIIDLAEAARVWAQRARLGTSSINHATAIKLKAEIKLAHCVDDGQARGDIATQRDGGSGHHVGSANMVSHRPATYDDLGLTRWKVHEARKIRDAFTPDAIDEIVKFANLQDKEIARKEFVKQRAHVSYSGGNNEWYTPTHFIEAARRAMGGIDVDPASNPKAQEWIAATTYYTKDDSGLERPWSGNVWLNPPYAQPLIGQFCDKVVQEYEAEQIKQAIVLVNNGTETKWGQRLLAACAAVCFPSGRIKFVDNEGNPQGTPLQGQMVAYIGEQPERFAAEFAQFGVVVKVWP